MKKIILGLLLILCTTVFTACTAKKEPSDTKQLEVEESTDKEPTAAAEQENEPTAIPEQAASDVEDDQQQEAAKAEKIDIKIAALKGPTGMGMVKMMEDAQAGTSANNYEFMIAGAADEITGKLIKGEIDIAAIPCNLASVLYNKTEGKIKLAGINTLGVLYIVEMGDTIHTVEDLRGKTIYSTGLGTTPQFTLNYILSANGIDPEKDVNIEYKSESTEVAALLSESSDAIAMLPQPYVTAVMMSNDKLRIALDIAKEWEAVSKDDSTVVTGVVIVRDEFLENNKEAFDAFMKEYAVSTAFVNENVDEAAALIEKYDIFKAGPSKKAIPYCNITLVEGDEMKGKVNGYLQVLFEQDPKSVGGKLPTDDIYYIQ